MFNLEKIFQKNDETYIALNRIICAIILYVSSILAFHLRENTALFIPIELVEEKFFFETKYFAAANIEILIYFLMLLSGFFSYIYLYLLKRITHFVFHL